MWWKGYVSEGKTPPEHEKCVPDQVKCEGLTSDSRKASQSSGRRRRETGVTANVGRLEFDMVGPSTHLRSAVGKLATYRVKAVE